MLARDALAWSVIYGGELVEATIMSFVGWIKRNFAPTCEPQLLALANGPIKDKVLAKLNLASCVAAAVRNQDVREFHAMINNLPAQHLVAVQVFGWALGVVVGLAQLAW